MTVTATLAQFVCATESDALPPAAVDAAKRAFLDTLGCAIAGSREPAAVAVLRMLERLGGAPSAGIVGSSLRTNAPQAALACGVVAHALDYDDDIGAGYGHPSAVLVPAVLALAEETGCRGRDVVAAYALGVEVWYRVARVLPRLHPLGWHPTGIFGSLGAAAAAARLMRLDAAQTTAALGLAGSQSAGLIQNLGTMTKPFHAGNAARAGIVSALLAADGYTATSEILEGGLGFAYALGRGYDCDATRMASDLGAPWAILAPGLNVKRYPCYYSAHKCIDAAIELTTEHRLAPRDVEAVHCRVPARVTRILFHTHPRTALEARFSMQFFMATAIARRTLGLAQFDDATVGDPVVRDLMARVRMSAHDVPGGGDPPHDYPDTVTISLRDGRTLERSAAVAKGHADRPLAWDELVAKFDANTAGIVAPGTPERLVGLLSRIESIDDLKPLLHTLHALSPPRPRAV